MVSILKDIPIDVVGTLTSLSFDQTGPTTVVPTGPSTGTFAIEPDVAKRMRLPKYQVARVDPLLVLPQYADKPKGSASPSPSPSPAPQA